MSEEGNGMNELIVDIIEHHKRLAALEEKAHEPHDRLAALEQGFQLLQDRFDKIRELHEEGYVRQRAVNEVLLKWILPTDKGMPLINALREALK
jgi:hypothetical protein